MYFQAAETNPIDLDNLPYTPTPAPTSSCTQFASAMIFTDGVEVTVAASGDGGASSAYVFYFFSFGPPELRSPPDFPSCQAPRVPTSFPAPSLLHDNRLALQGTGLILTALSPPSK
ncbi:hypothetical protein C8R45DRAFT_1107913 [Mycena sanguinolenta]|nr:hypothetical protein C8R45DRAFT_1107913 [Mycena sanguinolenta]